jgi:tripartite motif-containing protein 71
VQEWALGSGSEAPTYRQSFGPTGEALEGRLAEPEAVALDSSGDIFIADSGHDRVIELSAEHKFLRQFGSEGSGEGQFKGIRGLATNKEGDLYVSDYGNDRVQEFSPSGAFLRAWGSQGNGAGQFSSPTGIAVDSSGNVWVLNSAGGALVQKFSATGTYISGFGAAGGLWAGPSSLAISGANLYVVESQSARVREFSSSGSLLASFDEKGSGTGKSFEPWGIAADPKTGNLYVSEVSTINGATGLPGAGASRVQEFSSAGSFIAAFGASGYGAGQLSSPKGVGVSASGLLFIADSANNRVQEWAP